MTDRSQGPQTSEASNASGRSGASASAPSGDGAEHVEGAIDFLRSVLRRFAQGAIPSKGAALAQSSTGEIADASPQVAQGPKATLGGILDELDERAFGMMLLLLALPCCLPFVYLLPQIVALPMLALSAQLAMGRSSPWLPKKLAERSFEIGGFEKVLDRSERYVGWFERFSRPRLLALTGPVGARIVGLLLLAPCASILVPLPATNSVPGMGVAIASVGLIERDGALVILGLLIGFAWITLLLVFGLEVATLAKDWLSARF